MHEAALAPSALGLLGRLNTGLGEAGFYLAGGNGLALQLGHRRSDDLDFFSAREFQPAVVARMLASKASYQEDLVSPGTLYCRLDGVKLSFLHYPVALLFPLLKFEGALVADWRDITAEKFKTPSQRGGRKDFVDLYACRTAGGLTVAEMAALVRRRFTGTGLNFYHVARSLAYFDDADAEPELHMLRPVPWETVKRFFTDNLAGFERHLLAG